MLASSLLRPPTVIVPSRLNNRYRPILDQAKETSVLIHEPDDENLLILRAALVDDLVLAQEHTANFAQFLLATTGGGAPRPDVLGRLAWIADLAPESYALFAPRYLRTFAGSALRGGWSRLEQFLQRWKEAAEVESDPDLLAVLTDQGVPEEYVDLPRPS